MQAYRIGKIQQPWTNFVPPIRGGLYNKYSDADTETVVSEDDKWSDWGAELSDGTSNSSASVGSLTPSESEIAKETGKPPIVISSNSDGEQKSLRDQPSALSAEGLSRAAYTAVLEEQEVLDDILAYPSLDEETQRAISLEYQALHERIQREGFYECRYSEYGKDSIRWFLLFGTFFYLLTAKWYLTSALFLGMFWVRLILATVDVCGHASY
jgi:delta8-fatty-acid desaturase